MAHLHRLIVVAALGLAVLLFAAPASAAIPIQSQYTGPGASDWFTSAQSACQAIADAKHRADPETTFTVTSATSSRCNYHYQYPGGQGDGYEPMQSRQSCPANSVYAGNDTCTCDKGFVESGNACVVSSGGGTGQPPGTPKEECKGLKYDGEMSASMGNMQMSRAAQLIGGTTRACVAGCEMTGRVVACVRGIKAGTAGETSCMLTGAESNGMGCNAGAEAGAGGTPEENPAKPKPDSDPKCDILGGMVTGTVNGQTVCVKAGERISETKNDKSTEKPDGTTSSDKTTERTTCNGDTCTTTTTRTEGTSGGGTTTTTTTKTCTGSTCTSEVKKETTNPDGSKATSKDKTDSADKASFCKENPEFTGCKDSKFTGSCSAGYSCEGDAATCAMAREIHTQNCKLNAETEASALFASESVKTGNLTKDLPGNETKSIGPGDFDTADALGGAACIRDLSVSVWRSSVNLPLSNICTYLAHLGTVLVAVSFLLAARIVTRG